MKSDTKELFELLRQRIHVVTKLGASRIVLSVSEADRIAAALAEREQPQQDWHDCKLPNYQQRINADGHLETRPKEKTSVNQSREVCLIREKSSRR